MRSWCVSLQVAYVASQNIRQPIHRQASVAENGVDHTAWNRNYPRLKRLNISEPEDVRVCTFSFLGDELLGLDRSHPSYRSNPNKARFVIIAYPGISRLKALPKRTASQPYLVWFHGLHLDHCIKSSTKKSGQPRCSNDLL